MVTQASDIDAAWLTAALDEVGIAVDARVESVRAASIGTGQVGENVRFELTWSSDDPALPRSVVGKFPSDNETSRATAAATNTYVREVGFYRDLSAHLPIRTPAVYRVEEDLAANDFLLLMEDITPATQGEQLTGCTVDQAELAIDAAADLHASTWGKADELVALEWCEHPAAIDPSDRLDLYRALHAGFIARYADRLTPDLLDVGHWIADHLTSIADALVADDLCLAHGDFRLDNMLFGSDESAPPLTVVDWQTARIGSGPADVAYFIGAGLQPADRRTHERSLIDRYHAALTARGVDADRDGIWRSYQLGSPSGYIMAVIASQLVGQTERGDEMFMAMATRHAEQILDLEVAAVVE